MGLSKEEQRLKQRESRDKNFYPSKKEREWKPVKNKKKNKKKKKVLKTVKPKVKTITRAERNNYAYKKTKKVALKYQRGLVINATKSELFLKEIFDERNIRYRFQKILIYENNSKFYILDFLVGNVVIELDGDHHYEGVQLKKDRIRDRYLKGLGYKVIRIRNRELYSNWSEIEYKLINAGVKMR